jgi:hypothetical protein
MTRNEAKKLLPIIEAYANGKDIQWKILEEWTDIKGEDFNIANFENWPVRIKPEPKTVPMTYDDFKGTLFFWVRCTDLTDHLLVTKINVNGLYYHDRFSLWSATENMEWSTDRINWYKFENEVTE